MHNLFKNVITVDGTHLLPHIVSSQTGLSMEQKFDNVRNVIHLEKTLAPKDCNGHVVFQDAGEKQLVDTYGEARYGRSIMAHSTILHSRDVIADYEKFIAYTTLTLNDLLEVTEVPVIERLSGKSMITLHNLYKTCCRLNFSLYSGAIYDGAPISILAMVTDEFRDFAVFAATIKTKNSLRCSDLLMFMSDAIEEASKMSRYLIINPEPVHEGTAGDLGWEYSSIFYNRHDDVMCMREFFPHKKQLDGILTVDRSYWDLEILLLNYDDFADFSDAVCEHISASFHVYDNCKQRLTGRERKNSWSRAIGIEWYVSSKVRPSGKYIQPTKWGWIYNYPSARAEYHVIIKDH